MRNSIPFVLIVLVLGTGAWGADISWINADPCDDSWCTLGNWQGSAVPGPCDVAIINPPPGQGPIVGLGCSVDVGDIHGPRWDSDDNQIMDITGGSVVVGSDWQWGTSGNGTATINISGSPDITVLGWWWRGPDRGTGILNISGDPNITVVGQFKQADTVGSLALVNIDGGTLTIGENWNLGEDGDSNVTISGGFINVSNNWTMQCREGSDCDVNISGGQLTFGGNIQMGAWFLHNVMGTATLRFSDGSIYANSVEMASDTSAIAILDMTGGFLAVTDELAVPKHASGTATINLHGGTIECGRFTHAASYSMDITEGKLVIDGDVVVNIESDFGAGYITAHGGRGYVVADYDGGTNKTTVTAVGFCRDLNQNGIPDECEIIDLGTLDENSSYAYATSINDSGQVVGASIISAVEHHAFLWDVDSGMIDLGTLGGNITIARCINEAGQVVGYISPDSILKAFLWEPDTGMVDLAPGGFNTGAWGINNNGEIVGSSKKWSTYEHACWWDSNGTMFDLGIVGEEGSSSATAINNNGQIVGYYRNYDGYIARAYIWDSANGKTDLGTLGGGDSYAYAYGINDRPEVVGQANSHAFLWDSTNGMRDLGTLGESRSQAEGINRAGQVVGEAGNYPTNRAFLYSDGVMLDLYDTRIFKSGWSSLSNAFDINNRGQIVGYGLTEAGSTHAFLVTIMLDCNGNGIVDPADIINGTSLDCNGNGIPDECDIGEGASSDVNMDGIPDECQIDLRDVRVVPIAVLTDPASTSEVRTTLPDSMPAVVRGGTYYIEVWASDVGTTNTGLTNVYVDLSFDSQTSATALEHGTIFTTFPSGTIQPGGVDEFGGSALPSGIEPNWVRVGWIRMSADVDIETCTISLLPSSSGVAALERGLIPWFYVDLGSVELQITPPVRSYNLDGDTFIGPGDWSHWIGSWLQSVPPADAEDDFDCDCFVGVGDLSWFATGWMKFTDDPTILYPPCPDPNCGVGGASAANAGMMSAEMGTLDMSTDVAFEVVVLDAQSGSDTTTTLPISVDQITSGQTYYVEVWVSDVGDIDTGVISAYVDLSFPGDVLSVVSISHGGIFTAVPDGSAGSSVIDELGGSTLAEGVGVEPEWTRVAVVQMYADAASPFVAFTLSPSSTGISAYGRGQIPWDDVSLGSFIISPPADLNNNGRVDLFDVAILAKQWKGALGDPSADIAPEPPDGEVDWFDLAALLEYWLEGITP